MGHRINLARTPAQLQTPFYQRMVDAAPACTPADVGVAYRPRRLTADELAREIDLAFARIISE
jgi:hypothetical protein